MPVLAGPRPQDVEHHVQREAPDIVVVSSFARILPAAMVETTPYINVHYAPLPAYRGRANVNWAIINGEHETAVTVHSIVPGLDAGPILIQRRVPIGPRDTVTDLYRELNATQASILPDAVKLRLTGKVGTAQDESLATYCCGRVPDDGLIDWSDSTESIDRLIRGLTSPYPGAFSYVAGNRIVVERASPVDDPPTYVGRIPGRVVRVNRDEGSVDVLTGDGLIRVEAVRVGGEAQRPCEIAGSLQLTFADFDSRDGRGPRDA
ncbi:methionyl-tRNA formyltransferase [uncultured Microbacterium sp.]|uniref:methionyl-tRNA formyltransferase n=1 Tax=uncultured Microbacterium sp. TaxID=191216 RepID=UPI00260297CF|nr:methionyl-tRNA formyltransferase [uncultured Microbacterium sp.]